MNRKAIFSTVLIIVVFSLITLVVWILAKAPYDIMVPAKVDWRESSVSLNEPVISLAQNSTKKNVIYAVTQNAFYISDNFGVSFRKVFTVRSKDRRDMPDLIFHRVDFAPAFRIVYFALCEQNKDTLFAYNCSDKSVKKVFEANFPITDIENGPNSRSVIFATYGEGIYRIGNSNRIKAEQIVKFKDISRFHFTSIACLQDGRIMAGFVGNPKLAPLPIVISDKNGYFNWEYIYAKVINADNILFNVNSVYCIRPSQNGIYVSTDSSSAPILFTRDGTNFSVVERIRKVSFPQSGIRYIQPVDKYEGIFFTEDFVDDSKDYPNILSDNVCFIRPNGKTPCIRINVYSNNDISDFTSGNLLNAFLAIPSENKLIISVGNKVYYARFTKELLLSGGI